MARHRMKEIERILSSSRIGVISAALKMKQEYQEHRQMALRLLNELQRLGENGSGVQADVEQRLEKLRREG